MNPRDIAGERGKKKKRAQLHKLRGAPPFSTELPLFSTEVSKCTASSHFLRSGGGSDRLWLLGTTRHTCAPALPTLSYLSDDRYIDKTLPRAGLFPGVRSFAPLRHLLQVGGGGGGGGLGRGVGGFKDRVKLPVTVFLVATHIIFLCLIGCFSMIIWTPTVLNVLYACVLYLHLFSAAEHVSHGKAL